MPAKLGGTNQEGPEILDVAALGPLPEILRRPERRDFFGDRYVDELIQRGALFPGDLFGLRFGRGE